MKDIDPGTQESWVPVTTLWNWDMVLGQKLLNLSYPPPLITKMKSLGCSLRQLRNKFVGKEFCMNLGLPKIEWIQKENQKNHCECILYIHPGEEAKTLRHFSKTLFFLNGIMACAIRKLCTFGLHSLWGIIWTQKSVHDSQIYSFFLSFFFLFMAIPAAYGSFQARSWIWAAAASHSHSHKQHQIWALPVTYAEACSNAGSLTHWTRPGI